MIYRRISKIDLDNNNFWVDFVSSIRKSLSSQQNLENKILVVQLQNIVSDNVNIIPKIEYKP